MAKRKNGSKYNMGMELIDRSMDLNFSVNKPIFEAPSRKIIHQHNQTITVQDPAVATGFMMASPLILQMAINGVNVPGLQDDGAIDENSLSDIFAMQIMSGIIFRGVDITALKLSTSTADNLNGLSIDVGTIQPDGTALVDKLQVDDYQDEYAQRTGIITIPVKIRMNLTSVIYIPFSESAGETLSVLAKFENADVYTR